MKPINYFFSLSLLELFNGWGKITVLMMQNISNGLQNCSDFSVEKPFIIKKR